MRPKEPVPFAKKFPKAHPAALKLLARLLNFDPSLRPTAEEALEDPYLTGLHNPAREPVAESVSKMDFEFERRKLSVEEVRDLIYREALEYHPQAKREYYSGESPSRFQFPSAVDNFKRQFAHLEGGGARDLRRQANSLPREQMARGEAGSRTPECVLCNGAMPSSDARAPGLVIGRASADAGDAFSRAAGDEHVPSRVREAPLAARRHDAGGACLGPDDIDRQRGEVWGSKIV